jgi:hypothetical protein
VTLAAFIVLLVIGRILFLYLRPERACRWCGNEPKRRYKCWRCNGDGHTWRLGSRLVRQVHLALVRAWQRWREDQP